MLQQCSWLAIVAQALAPSSHTSSQSRLRCNVACHVVSIVKVSIITADVMHHLLQVPL